MSKKNRKSSGSQPAATSVDSVKAPIPPELKPIVIKLRDPIAEKAIEAIDELVATRNPAAVGPLVEVLQNTDRFFHTVTRSAAAMALGRMGFDDAIAPLTAASQDTVAEVSSEAILSLGELRARAAVGTLTAIVINVDNYYLSVTRHAALRSLGRIGDMSAKPLLTEIAARTTEDPSIIGAAREALKHL